jgi:hypothetical protein
MRRTAATLPRMPRKTKLGLREQAYELLGVDDMDVVLGPKIEPLLKTAGVLEKVWSYLETSGDEMARLLIAQKYKLATKSQRDAVPLEAYCLAAKLDPKKVLGLIFAEVYSQNEQAAGLMAAAAQPDIVRATIDRAVEPGGTRERDMMHKHSRFVPVPQTSVTFVRKAGKVIGGDDNSQTLAVLPPIEKVVRDVSDRFNERLLTAPAPEILEVDFEDEDEDDNDEEVPV